MKDILKHRDELAKMNLPYLWNACQGMYYNKFKLLENGTEGTRHLVEQYGYDTKQAQHCYRSLDFLGRYFSNGFSDFKKAIWYEEGPERDFLMGIKRGAFNLADFKEIVIKKREEISGLEAAYKAEKPEVERMEWLDSQIYSLIWLYIKNSEGEV